MKKKLLLLAVFVSLFACIFAICVSAVEYKGIYYSLDTNAKTATVTNENVNCTLETVVIPESIEIEGVTYLVTKVDVSAFSGSGWPGNKTIKSVTIPRTVKSIGTHVFRNCSNLETVVINAIGYDPETGKGTAEIAFTDAEFYYCTGLVSVDMSKSNVVGVGSHCFTQCGKLTTVLFSSKIRSIGSSFTGCGSLTTINVDSLKSLQSIDVGFYGTKISGDLVLPNIKSLGTSAFRGTNITSVDLSGSKLETVGGYAFQSCYSLIEVKLPNTVKTIDTEAFRGCYNMTEFNFPTSLEKVGGWGFNSCSALTGDFVGLNVISLGDNSFQGTRITRIVLPKLSSTGKDVFNNLPIKTAILGADVSGVASTVFSGCGSLRAVVYLGEDGNVAKNKISTLGSFTVKSFDEFDATVDYGAGSEKIIFAGAKTLDGANYVSYTAYDKPFSIWNSVTNDMTKYNPIITHLGFSTNPNGNNIATGFKIDRFSLEAYEELYGTLNFGVFIFNPTYLGADSFMVTDEQGTKLNTTKGTIEVAIDTKYSTCNVYVNGFGDDHKGLELVFAGYAYVEGKIDQTLGFIQKEYNGTVEKPVTTPMASVVTRGDKSLYTVTLGGILAPVQITTGKEGLNEFGA